MARRKVQDFDIYGLIKSPDRVYHIRPVGSYRPLCFKETTPKWIHITVSYRWDRRPKVKVCEKCAEVHEIYLHNRYRRERRSELREQGIHNKFL